MMYCFHFVFGFFLVMAYMRYVDSLRNEHFVSVILAVYGRKGNKVGGCVLSRSVHSLWCVEHGHLSPSRVKSLSLSCQDMGQSLVASWE